MQWSEPKNFSEWIARLVSVSSFCLGFLILAVLIAELRFGWLEQMLGGYLVSTNARRPETGAIWDVGHQTRTALATLEEIVSSRQSSQREARGAETLAQIISGLTADQGVMIAKEHFRALYNKLPAVLSQEILSPYGLLQLCSQGRWNRAYFNKNGEALKIYFLDQHNQVLRQVTISSDLLYLIRRGEVAIDGTLKNLSDFADQVYPADRFFDALDSLPEEVRRGILPQPLTLLQIDGRIVQVGISDEVEAENVGIGFEFEQANTHKVILVQGRQWDVWQLRRMLEHEQEQRPAAVPNPPGDGKVQP
jgi:hypothetical protein